MTGRLVAALGACVAALAVAGTNPITASVQTTPDLPPVLSKAIAYYSTLASYADTGTITREAPGILDTSKFTTYFRRATRDFYLEYQAITSANPANKFTIDMSVYRRVIWMYKGGMETYDFRTGDHELINAEGGAQVRTLTNSAHGTEGISTLITGLLNHTQARLPGAISQIEQASVAGIEEVDKRPCHKVVGVAAAYYPSGQRTNIRPVTVWIDTQSQLVRRVFEDTPKGYAANSYQRRTTAMQPQANPTLDDAKFQFKVPER